MTLIPPDVPTSSPVVLDGNGWDLDRQEFDATVATRAANLADAGVRGDVIAICQPSDVQLALNVLAAMTVGAAAPLNPSVTEQEAQTYLEDVRPRLIVTASYGPAGRAARNLGIEVLEPEGLADERGGRAPERPDETSVTLLLPTSGTTGRPKLVPLTRNNVMASARNVAASLELTSRDRCLGMMPYFHVHGLVAGLLAPILSGGSVVAAGSFDPLRIQGWLEELEPTWYTAVPTMHRAVLDSISRRAPAQHQLRFVRSSSSPLPPELMKELEDALGVPVIEAYGMTEAAHQMAANPLPPAPRKPGSVGVASGSEIALLTNDQIHRDVDRSGEVVVRGPSLTAGYRDHPEANAAAFHDGWFRTGDLGRLDSDGYLRLVGRLKEMINRGGEKIAPREVEEALLEHPAVAQAVAFPCPHPTLGEDVAAVVVVRGGHEVSATDLMQFVSNSLSSHKVPRRLVFAERIPVGPTGKPRRHQLAEDLGLLGGLEEERGNGTLSDVAAIWSELLVYDQVPRDVDFFALGGDSLRALTLVSTVEDRLGQTVPLTFFSDGPATLARMEDLIARVGPAPTSGFTAMAGGETISSAERNVLARSLLDPDEALYNEPMALRIHGPLDLRRLEVALQAVAAANEGLRTCFPMMSGRPVRTVAKTVASCVEVQEADKADDLADLLRNEARRPFDLERGPLYRAKLFVFAEHDHVLMLTVHHSVIDGLAKDLVLAAVGAAYRQPSASPPPAGSPAAVAARQQADLAEGKLDQQQAYWINQLTPLPPPLEFPHERQRRDEHRWPGEVIGLELDAVTSDSLRTLARHHRTTPFAVFLAGVAATLSRLTGATEIVIGTPTANRHHKWTAGIVGLLANMVPLRVDVTGDPTFDDLVQRVRQVVLGAFANQEYPYERMIRDVRPYSTVAVDGLFRVVCQLRGSALTPDFGPDFRVSRMAVHNGMAKSDLSFDMLDEGQVIRGSLEFHTDVFDRAQAQDLCQRLGRLLASAVRQPSRNLSSFALLDVDELRGVVERARGPVPVPAARSVVELVIDQARRTPALPAVTASDGVMSYGELDERSARMASALAQRGIGCGDAVALSLVRNRTTIAASLGVLRAGAACLPLDPSYPALRLEAMVAASSARFFVYAGHAPSWLPSGIEAVSYEGLLAAPLVPAEPPGGPDPDDAAYILFTSGSTGAPKGVVIPHSAIVNMLSWTSRTFSRQELDRVLVGTSLNFDFSVMQIYAPLAVGGCAVMADDVLAVRELPTPITLLGTSATPLGALLDDDAIPSHVQTIVSGGEVLTKELAARLLALPQRPRLVNIYGPTETTVLCSAAEVTTADDTPPIGRPIDGALTLVLDRLGQPLPAGTPGELWVGGRGLTHGYVNDASLTAERFVATDVPGLGPQRMYRTGDLTWADEDGGLHFVRRLDNQLKLRGMRIEPGDVEAALLVHPDVTAAAVYAVGSDGGRELHAAIVSRSGPVDAEELRSFAKRRLPRHMVPRRVHDLERLPLTPNGKVDRHALAAMSTDAKPEWTPDQSGRLEYELLATWRRLLETEEVDLDTDFFDAGGDSLLVLAMLAEVERLHGCRLPLAWCFDGPVTVRGLAAQIQRDTDTTAAGNPEASASTLIPVRRAGGRPPLYFIFADARTALSARLLVDMLEPDRPVYALAPNWTNVASRIDLVEQMASSIAATTNGLAHLAGHSIGGLIAYETAALLEQRGHPLGALVLVDTYTPAASRRRQRPRRRVRVALGIPAFWRAEYWRPAGPDMGVHHFPHTRVLRLYWSDDPAPLRRPVDLLIAENSQEPSGARLGWDDIHQGDLNCRIVAGNHNGVLQPPNLEQLARNLDACLNASESIRINVRP